MTSEPEAMRPFIKLSIVISMHNSNEEVLEIIEKLLFPSLCQNGDKTKELILLDDLSPLKKKTDLLVEGYRDKLASSFAGFKYIRNKKNLGFAGSYNKGIKLAKGEQILIANSDVYFPKDSINSLMEVLKQNDKFGVVGPVTNEACSYQNTNLFQRLRDYSRGEIGRIERFASWLKKVMEGQYIENLQLIGFCLCCKAEVFRRVGYFDPRFKAGGAEDIDLLSRARKYYSIVLDCSTFVEHGGTQGASLSLFRGGSLRRLFHYAVLNPLRYARKWGNCSILFFSLKGLLQYLFDIDTVTSMIIKEAKTKKLWDEYKRLK
ncbi:hypothetical protein COY35_01630 [candidate division WWE3 bacterium CG_4_10_14_0_2_um_filter_47_8]|nr:MAG: hypothetical protein COY35_01630 [candidate division WWE3 bacterium CG_4_10_14_0_2_um_filter_47_8]